jgi:hypothetical protein
VTFHVGREWTEKFQCYGVRSRCRKMPGPVRTLNVALPSSSVEHVLWLSHNKLSSVRGGHKLITIWKMLQRTSFLILLVCGLLWLGFNSETVNLLQIWQDCITVLLSTLKNPQSTRFMGRSLFWEASSSSAGIDISRPLRIRKMPYLRVSSVNSRSVPHIAMGHWNCIIFILTLLY